MSDQRTKARLAVSEFQSASRTKFEAERDFTRASGILFVSRHRDPKFYTARTKRAVNSLTVERGPKNGGGK